MQPKELLSISITYRKPKDIEEVKRLSGEIGGFKQAEVYLVGLRKIAKMIKKADVK